MGKLNLEASREGKEAHSHMMYDEKMKALKNIAHIGRVRYTMWLEHRSLKGKGERNEARVISPAEEF